MGFKADLMKSIKESFPRGKNCEVCDRTHDYPCRKPDCGSYQKICECHKCMNEVSL